MVGGQVNSAPDLCTVDRTLFSWLAQFGANIMARDTKHGRSGIFSEGQQ
jgi:hypothetical protein